jgi:type II secretory pathway pseudopilin PulG
MPPTDRTLGERLFETAAKGYRDIRGAENLPAHERIYMESVMDRRRDPITEKSFKPDELNAIRDVITRRYNAIQPKLKEDVTAMRPNAAEALREAVAARNPEARAFHMDRYREITANMQSIQSYLQTGKLNPKLIDWAKKYDIQPNIQYENYGKPDRIGLPYRTASDTESQVGQVLGRFTYTADPQGNLSIADKYDFDPYKLTAETEFMRTPIGLGDFISSPKQVARKYAGKYLPPEQGRPVSIQLNAAAPKTKKPENWFSRTATALGF